jgi:hypothetical protein
MARLSTATKIINQVAVEVGLDPVADPMTDGNSVFVQLRYLLNTVGLELVLLHEWNHLKKEWSFTTTAEDDGTFTLPTNWYYMIDQTGWERANNTPMAGPVSSQDWQYLKGMDLDGITIYPLFRFFDDELNILPDPPGAGLEVHMEYISRNWVQATGGGDFSDEVSAGNDEPQFDPLLVQRALKLKFLDAKGFDTTSAQDDFNEIFSRITGRDQGSLIVNTGNRNRGFPLLDMHRNVPNTGYGS